VMPEPAPAPPFPDMRLITVSASYGAGGSVVAPALAGRLGLPFLQRVTTSEGHLAEPGPCDEQLSMEEVKATPVHRLLAHFTQAMPAGPTQSPPSTHHQDEHLRGYGEAGIRRFLAAGGGVILGRAAAVVLGKDRGYHVRLDGPAARRVAQGAAVEGISQDEARQRLRAADKARTAYVRRLYRCDPADPALYHLVIDSTAIPLDTVIELILAGARAHAARPEGATARS
jgi:cytidylate kinase